MEQCSHDEEACHCLQPPSNIDHSATKQLGVLEGV
jgi:hypothetical protein